MQKNSNVLVEAKRLHALGFAILWLRPRSKIPTEGGWTSGPRKTWEELQRQYREGMNVGVRLGTPSRVETSYLAVVDVDVKSTDPRHRKEAVRAAKKALSGAHCPVVMSGRGNGSRHYYLKTRKPFKTFNAARSEETVRVMMPSKKASRAERDVLPPEEIAKGLRLAPAWEVSLYSDGRQVVLPPSVHPDTGREYTWGKKAVTGRRCAPLVDVDIGMDDGGKKEKAPGLEDFQIDPVELSWLPISKKVRDGITKGTGVTDRSAFLLTAATALASADLSRNEILTVLTSPKNFISSAASERRSSRKSQAEWLWTHTLSKVVTERDATSVFAKAPLPEDGRKLTFDELVRQDRKTAAEAARDWKDEILRGPHGGPLKVVQNVVHIITHEVGGDVIRRDEFAYRDTYLRKTPWGSKKNAVVSDDDISSIKYWLGCNFGFEPSTNTISDALVVLATRNAYDPVRDALDALPRWDLVPRLGTWLRDHFGAKDDTDYLAQVFRKWMVAMVMRVYEPGAKFDWMPIFEGRQGAGKSSFGNILVGDRYFLDWLPNLNDKDSLVSLQGVWGVEMGELSQFRRNELESIKAFITRKVDKFRPPYGRRLIESPRRCVFFGTTNRTKYLIDETGNRRFKPVMVGDLDFERLRKDRDQLLAEARFLYRTKTETTFDLTGRARAYESQIHREKMVEDDSHSMEESMRDFMRKVEKGETNFDLRKFVILDLFRGVGPLGNWRPENKNLQFCAKMLKRLGGRDRLIRGRKTWKIENSSEGGGFL